MRSSPVCLRNHELVNGTISRVSSLRRRHLAKAAITRRDKGLASRGPRAAHARGTGPSDHEGLGARIRPRVSDPSGINDSVGTNGVEVVWGSARGLGGRAGWPRLSARRQRPYEQKHSQREQKTIIVKQV